MTECDDVVEVAEVAESATLSEYVTARLNTYVEGNRAEDKLYGIFYNGVRLSTRAGKTSFSSPGAAKNSLHQAMRYYAINIAGVDPKLSWGAKLALFREETLRQVEIRELGSDAIH